MFATAVLSSGSNFQKVQMFANILKLPILSRCTYFRIQRTYLIPCIDDFWIDQQNDVINTFQGQDLVILGNCFFFSIIQSGHVFISSNL